jgi:hypothetical protein
MRTLLNRTFAAQAPETVPNKIQKYSLANSNPSGPARRPHEASQPTPPTAYGTNNILPGAQGWAGGAKCHENFSHLRHARLIVQEEPVCGAPARTLITGGPPLVASYRCIWCAQPAAWHPACLPTSPRTASSAAAQTHSHLAQKRTRQDTPQCLVTTSCTDTSGAWNACARLLSCLGTTACLKHARVSSCLTDAPLPQIKNPPASANRYRCVRLPTSFS